MVPTQKGDHMITRAILVTALLLPIAAHAEDMFRWRDARGRLHYSNDTEKVPQGAQVVTKRLGEIGGEPIGAAVAPEPAAERPSPSAQTSWNLTPPCPLFQGLWALPDRAVDFNHRDFFDVDAVCGPQHDIEGWLRRASSQLAMREIGL
jgi:hypothetical protein